MNVDMATYALLMTVCVPFFSGLPLLIPQIYRFAQQNYLGWLCGVYGILCVLTYFGGGIPSLVGMLVFGAMFCLLSVSESLFTVVRYVLWALFTICVASLIMAIMEAKLGIAFPQLFWDIVGGALVAVGSFKPIQIPVAQLFVLLVHASIVMPRARTA